MRSLKQLFPFVLIVTSCSVGTDANLAGGIANPQSPALEDIDSLEETASCPANSYDFSHVVEDDDDLKCFTVTGSLIQKSYQVAVLFSTNRGHLTDTQGKLWFTSKRAGLKYGFASVNIPRKTHIAGQLERPKWWKLELGSNSQDHFLIQDAEITDYATWISYIRSSFKKGGRRRVLLFVHGYNVSFTEAIMRTAQIAWDVQFPGAPIVFSWPSQGRLVGYPADEAAAEFAAADFKKVLDQIVTSPHVDDVFIVAHSMGNRIVTRALTDDISKASLYKRKIRDVILAAPDIDADVFRTQISPRLPGSARRVTLYASTDDAALAASKKFHGGYPRAGDAGPNLLVSPLIDTIDASGLSTDWLGHSYVSNSPTILKDMRALIETDLPPTSRGHRFRRYRGSGYWVVRR